MSVRYSELVIPDVESIDYHPRQPQLLALLETLESLGWTRDIVDDQLYQTLEQARAAVREWQPADPLRLYIAGGMSERTPLEWPEDEPVFEPFLCEDVEIVCSPALLIFPSGMNGAVMPCTACEEDLVEQAAAQDDAAWADGPGPPVSMLIQNGYRAAPSSCAACGVQLDYRTLALDAGDIVEAPFFRLGIKFLSARSPAVPLVYFEPEFLAALGASCGTPLRSAGLWE